MPLTDTAIRNAKPGATPKKLTDGFGMYLEISPAGGRYWRIKYRFGGKENRLSLGVYPIVSLQAARSRRDEIRRELANGDNPSATRKADKVARTMSEGSTFETVAREWWAKTRPIWTPGHARSSCVFVRSARQRAAQRQQRGDGSQWHPGYGACGQGLNAAVP